MRILDPLLPVAAALLIAAAVPAQDQSPAATALGATQWRNLGPANFGGRIVDIEVDPRDRFVWYAATATGGLWKTTNNGTTFEPLFDDRPVFSIGDIAIAPSAPDVIYVGTGEANNQRSSYHGDGVHKSTDGGRTWRHVGLVGSDHIGRIVVHPTNPDIVFVAALGALYRANDERGLYRSTDGGTSWHCVKHIDADVGFVDVAIDPRNPQTLLAASYDRRRRAWDFRDEGPGSKLWRSSDGGESWAEVDGIPGGAIGRIGIAIHPVETEICYAIVENNNPAPPREPAEEVRGDEGPPREAEPLPPAVDPEFYPYGFGETDEAPGAAGKPLGGELYRSADGGATWAKVSERPVGGSPHYYYGQVRIDPNDPNVVYVLGVQVWSSRDGGAKWEQSFGRSLHVDHHALWLDPSDSRRALIGNDGGIAQTWDGGQSWRYHDDLPIGQYYAIAVDRRDPYVVYGGTQDNGTWGIPSRSTTTAPLTQADAYKISGGDGFHVCVDPTDADLVYSESQFGGLSRTHLDTNERRNIKPRAQRGQPRLRFNWMTPLLLSPHDAATLYCGSQYLHCSHDRGEHWEVISPDLTTNDPDKLAGDVPHCTITTIDESPVDKGRLLVGTDDGRVWTSRNGGDTWIDLGDRFDDMPPQLWVSRVAWSPHDAERAYVSFTGYREDDRRPYLFLTTDGGTTFVSIVNDLPPGEAINVVCEHPRNPDCVLVGTEFGCYASIDGGGSWQRLGSGLPTQPVHDLLVHPREEDIVIGTHGRGIWILDGSVVAELDDQSLAGPIVFQPRDGRTLRRAFQTVRYPGERGWSVERAQQRALFRYFLPEDLDDDVTLRVRDILGEEVFSRQGESTAGLHEIPWEAPRGARRSRRAATPPGEYLLQVEIGDRSFERTFRVHPAAGPDPEAAADAGDESSDAEGDERGSAERDI